MKTIQLKRGKTESLQRFHPWIFSGALVGNLPSDLREGECVRVVDADGAFVAVGHYQEGSIAVRVLSFAERLIDSDFYRHRLASALQARQAMGLTRLRFPHALLSGEEREEKYGDTEEPNTIFRLVHGEGDQLPGLVIDIYGATAVVQAHSAGMHCHRELIADALLEVCPFIKAVYYKSEGTLPCKAGIFSPDSADGFLRGNTTNDIARESGLSFHIDYRHGQKTGFFIDQRDNRRLLEHYAQGHEVLNMFCYTGGFSVYALRGGARRVVSVDSSSRAIDLTRQNVQLNFPNDSRHEAVEDEAFHFLAHEADHFSLIILDPPAFAKHKDALRNALKGYTRLNAIALQKIKPGGVLFTFSCSQAVSKEQFRLAVFTAATQSRRHVRILHQLHQAPDHPINIYHPEGEYLKGLVLQVE